MKRISIAVAIVALTAGCHTQQVRVAVPPAVGLPEKEVTVSMPHRSYHQGGVVILRISNVPQLTPTVQILSGTQVVATKTVSPLHFAQVDDHYAIELTVDGKPLPPGAYELRFSDRQKGVLAFRIKK
jgi:hypothetical protein